jgi:peptidoglycan hydrolase-like amidase
MPAINMIQEPIIRVGLHSTPDTVKISSLQPYTIKDAQNQTLVDQGTGVISTVMYDRATKHYFLALGENQQRVSGPVRFIGQQKDQIFELINYTRRLGDNNYNKYRGIIEFSYSPVTDKVWLINEIALEDYLKGLDETSDASPEEFQKALLIAARTYGLHHYNRGTKHANDNFTIDALYDQIYRGVVAEQKHPLVQSAVAATRGLVVTYNNEPVITPYFSQSDGRTRNWEEVWGGGPYPWLVSVPDPYNQGRELLGHGVGLSAQGALKMASTENKSFVQILQYYYHGTEVQRIYN